MRLLLPEDELKFITVNKNADDLNFGTGDENSIRIFVKLDIKVGNL